MEKRKFEVAIVGGGPAGSTCGYELAKAGVDVAIFDHSHPREKPCGGAISARILKYMKLPDNVIERKIDWLFLESPNGSMVKIKSKNAGFFVMRKKMDSWMLQRAKKAGVIIIEEQVIDVNKQNGVWRLYTKKGVLESKFLIGADGINSVVRKKIIGPIPKKDIGHCVGYHIKHKKEYINSKFQNSLEIYFIGQPYVSSGYAWIFPKYEHITVGIGSKLGTHNLSISLEKFLKEHHSTKRIKLEGKKHFYSHLVPAIGSLKFLDLPTAGPEWAVIGDAAGHVNPITGEGIYYAVIDGILAARAYKKGDLTVFHKLWKKEYGNDLLYGAIMQKFFYKKIIINKIIATSKTRSSLQKTLVDLIFTRDNYRNILIKLLLNFIF